MQIILAALAFVGFCGHLDAMDREQPDSAMRIPQPDSESDLACRALYSPHALPNIIAPVPSNPWFQAALSGDLETCLSYIKQGRKIDEKDDQGWTALLWAAKGGHHGLCRLLLKQALLTQLSVRYYLLCLRKLLTLGDGVAYFLYQHRDDYVKPYLMYQLVSLKQLLAARVKVEDYVHQEKRYFHVVRNASFTEWIEKNAYDFLLISILDPKELKNTKALLRKSLSEKPEEKNSQTSQLKICGSCKKKGAVQRCGRCKSAYYCDSSCQKSHWPEHCKLCKI